MTPKAPALLFAAALWLGPAAPRAQATDLHNVLVDYTLTSWTEKDGLPSSIIWAIAQDHEGYLWLGTDAGPLRFDGARFVAWESVGLPLLPKAPVRALCVSHDGALWFGLGDAGGVSRLHQGQLQNYSVKDGIPEGAVTMLFEDPAGTMWAGNSSGLFAFANGRWETSNTGLPRGPVYSAKVDGAGGFLVGTASGVFRRGPGEKAFEPADVVGEVVRGIAQDRTGTIWVTDPIVGFRRLAEQRASVDSREQGRGNKLLQDSIGNLWVGTSRQGLWRVRFDAGTPIPVVEKTTALTGFSDDGVNSLFEDSEGNLWAGTLDGLNRLTPHKITPITDLGLVGGVEITRDGSVWVGTVDAVIRFSDGNVRSRRAPEILPGLLSAMHADEAGRLWVAAGSRLFRFEAGQRSVVKLAGDHPPQKINALTTDAQGGLWISDVDQGLLRWDGARLKSVALPPEVRQSRIVTPYVDRGGQVWLAFENGRVAAVNPEGAVVSYGPENGLDAGGYRLIYQDHDGAIWLGGSGGLSRFKNGRFSTLHAANGFPTESLTAIVEDDAGCLWLGTEGSGIVRVASADLEKVLANSAYPLPYRVFDKFDGLAGTARWFGNRSAVRTKDGRLWFVAGRGVTVIDPRALPEGPPAPVRVRVEGVVANDRRIPASDRVTLPAGTTRVQIDYAVLSLTSAFKTHFRYRLDGFDRDWIDAGSRRQAFYTNLPPRDFQFRVIASNDDGTWSESAGTWTFAIQPRFYQTAWFLAACVLGLSASVAAAWRIHVNRMRNQFSLLLGERVRLSREIHDTLLQGLFGVALRCDGIADSLNASAPWLREQFLQMRKDVQDYIHEARQSIQDLRSPRLVGRDLTVALREAGERAIAGSPVRFEFAVHGTPRGCSGNVQQQLLRIGQEAVINAVRHAQAQEIRVELEYDESAVTLRISDDGCGFDPSLLNRKNGHYGLVSMKERAESVGGTLTIDSSLDRGAQIRASLPA